MAAIDEQHENFRAAQQQLREQLDAAERRVMTLQLERERERAFFQDGGRCSADLSQLRADGSRSPVDHRDGGGWPHREGASARRADRQRRREAVSASTSVVEALRNIAAEHVTITDSTRATLTDAADEIERLRARIASDAAYCDRWRAELREALDAPPAMSLVGAATILRMTVERLERSMGQRQ